VSISGSRVTKSLALLPFGYTSVTRLKSARDIVYLVLSSWLPATWYLFRSADISGGEALRDFALGYLAFIALYEIGYLANDYWDARNSEAGRLRVPFTLGTAYASFFIAIRLAVWVAVAVATGWIADTIWLAAYGALVIVFAEHNLIAAPGMRSASFFQLAILRFALPVLAPTPTDGRLALFVVAVLFYAYLRFLSYLDSKDLLAVPERRLPTFSLAQIAMILPLSGLVAWLAQQPVVLELWAYFLACFAGWALLDGLRARAAK
jgi:hypothetical protein